MWRRHLQIGIFTLALLLALPLNAQVDNDCGGSTPEGDQICLRWFDADNGAKKEIIFNTEVSSSICTSTQMACAVEKHDGTPLLDCRGSISPSENVKYDEVNHKFVVKNHPSQLVDCFNEKEERIIPTDSDKRSGWRCEILNKIAIVKRWDKGPILQDGPINLKKPEDTKKAEPWNKTGQSYCPDPLPRGAIDAYTFTNKPEQTETAPELIQRYLLQSCSRVVSYHKLACEEAAAEISNKISKLKKDAQESEEELKNEIIGEIILGAQKECAGDCAALWEKIRKLDKKVFLLDETQNINPVTGLPQSQGGVLTGSTIERIEVTAVKEALNKLKIPKKELNTIMNWLLDNQTKWTKAKKGTLDQYISAIANSEWTVENEKLTEEAKETDIELKDLREKEKKIQEIVSFLNKRHKNLQLRSALSESQTYNVTDLLRRSKDSSETDLVVFGGGDGSGKVNIIDKVILLVGQIIGSFGVLLLIISAVIMIVSQGEETMLQKAKQTFFYTLVGLALSFLSFTIVRFLLELLLTK